MPNNLRLAHRHCNGERDFRARSGGRLGPRLVARVDAALPPNLPSDVERSELIERIVEGIMEELGFPRRAPPPDGGCAKEIIAPRSTVDAAAESDAGSEPESAS